MNRPVALSTNSANDAVRGQTEPRLWTPSLRPLDENTSYGYDVIDFADQVLGTPLDPWQQWVAVHAGELLPDGRPRFRTVLILVARQNGKTLLAKVLTLYWLFIDQAPMVLGTSTNRDYAKRVWRELCDQAQGNEHLAAELGPDPIRRAIGEEELRTAAGATYKFAATNRRAGRSLTVHRLLLDELREHDRWDAFNAATNAMNAVPHGQVIAITNQGDDTSVVLDALRDPALHHLATGDGDQRLGLFEYSAPDGADPEDPQALAQANPNLGHRIDPDALLSSAQRAKAAGGEELAGFRTEVMCQRVHQLDPALDLGAWDNSAAADPVDLASHRDRLALCVDVSLDGSHAGLVAAAVLDGKVHLEVIEAWNGYGSATQLRQDLPAIVRQVRPRALGWFPAGPAASVTADIADRGGRSWPPSRVEVQEIRNEATAVCMGFAEQVRGGSVVHPDDPVLNRQVRATTRFWRGDAWVFGRKGSDPIDTVYAAAGAVHLARTLPEPLPPLAVVT